MDKCPKKAKKKCPFSHNVTLSLQNIKKNFTLIKSTKKKNLRFLQTNAHVIGNLWPQGVQIEMWQQRHFPCYSQNPNCRVVKEITSTKIQIEHQKNYWIIWSYNYWTYLFLEVWSFQRDVGFDLEMAQTYEHCFNLKWWGGWVAGWLAGWLAGRLSG